MRVMGGVGKEGRGVGKDGLKEDKVVRDRVKGGGEVGHQGNGVGEV